MATIKSNINTHSPQFFTKGNNFEKYFKNTKKHFFQNVQKSYFYQTEILTEKKWVKCITHFGLKAKKKNQWLSRRDRSQSLRRSWPSSYQVHIGTCTAQQAV